MSISSFDRGTLALCLYTLLPLAHAGSIWNINIDESPAPSPADGPPLSAHATRDRALLPYQILGIVGSYFAVTLILGTFTATVGRSRRLKAERSAYGPVEMVKPPQSQFDPSPISPQDSRGWMLPSRLRTQKSISSSIKSGFGFGRSAEAESVTSFDPSVLEADRLRRQDEMERLYAAVMQHDELRSQQSEPDLDGQSAPPPPRYTRQQSLTVNTNMHPRQADGEMPQTPRTVARAIYPPEPVAFTSPASPVQSFSPRPSSPPKRLRKSLRQLKISAPLPIEDNDDGARTPLSPRVYMNPATPPEPPSACTVDGAFSGREQFQEERYQPAPHRRVDEMRALPQPHPSRAHHFGEDGSGTSLRPPVASVNNTLPFRQMAAQQRIDRAQRQAQLPPLNPPRSATSAAFPLSPAGPWNVPASAGPVKTTFLEARRDFLAAGPRTGAATPYSPYMPFTPVTPVTPYLPSRRERRLREKEARTAHGVLTEEDEVKDDKELWGSAY